MIYRLGAVPNSTASAKLIHLDRINKIYKILSIFNLVNLVNRVKKIPGLVRVAAGTMIMPSNVITGRRGGFKTRPYPNGLSGYPVRRR